MRRLMTIIAKLIYQYGTIYSRKPSAHGSYEAPVPQLVSRITPTKKNSSRNGGDAIGERNLISFFM